MGSANVDLERTIVAAWERGDYSSAEWAHPEIEYVRADGPAPGSWTGLAGMAEAPREFLSAWEEYRLEAEEYRELDGERVLVLDHRTGRGKASGLELGQMQAKGAPRSSSCSTVDLERLSQPLPSPSRRPRRGHVGLCVT